MSVALPIRWAGVSPSAEMFSRGDATLHSLTYRELCMALELSAVFRNAPEGYIGFVEQLPGAKTQGATLAKARANLREAVALTLAANRAPAEEDS